jgi:Uma2 family endonuclease
MSEAAAKKKQRFTGTDYWSWNDDKRWEIIGGEAFLMASPTSRHQQILMELARQTANHFKGKSCRAFMAPMDVLLSEEDVVQPDLLVVCDPKQIKRTHIEGAPTLVVEILSGDAAFRDKALKLDLYARSGVKEYWGITPWPSMVEVLLLQAGEDLVHHVFAKDDTLASPTCSELQLTLRDEFDFPLEPGQELPVAEEPPGRASQAAR